MHHMYSPAMKKERDRKAAEMFRLWAVEGKTQQAIGQQYGISKQRVGQLIRPFIEELKSQSNT